MESYMILSNFDGILHDLVKFRWNPIDICQISIGFHQIYTETHKIPSNIHHISMRFYPVSIEIHQDPSNIYRNPSKTIQINPNSVENKEKQEKTRHKWVSNAPQNRNRFR